MPVSRKYRVVGDTPAIDAAALADGVRLLPNPNSSVEPVLTPYWSSECGRAVVYVGDNLTVMRAMDRDQFHAVVTDPPYGLEFMGKEWDAPWKQDDSTDARQHRADELADPIKVQYLRHGVTYGGVGGKRRGGGGFNSNQQEDNTGRGTWAFGGTPSSENRVVYGLSDPQGFQAWLLPRAEGALRVARPGAHLLSFGGTRMWHRMTCAVEDAGWEVRDTIMWVYGSGFPKSHDVSKAIDKKFGVERTEVIAPGTAPLSQGQFNAREMGSGGYGYAAEYNVMAPVTDAAKQWDGWGTALKPAVEPIVMARKPMPGTVAQCVMEHGTGALNIDGCRVGAEERWNDSAGNKDLENRHTVTPISKHGETSGRPPVGRWPANLVLTHHPECVLVGTRVSSDATSPGGDHRGTKVDGERSTVGSFTGTHVPTTTAQRPDEEVWDCHPDCPAHLLDEQGGASRFFYTAKADHSDRPHGKGATTHPTVKPLDLMRYLVRLVCAPGSRVLDPFMGSGSTGCAAIEEGMRFVGIEQSREYADVAVGRLKLALAGRPAITVPPAPGGAASACRDAGGAPAPRRLRGVD